MNKNNFILLISFFLAVSSYSNNNSTNIDSLKQLLKNTTNDTLNVELRVKIGELTWLFRASYWDSIIQDAERLKLFKIQGNALNNIGFIYEKQGNNAKGIEYYEKAYSLYKKHNYENLVAGVLNNLGESYRNLGQIEKAIEYHENSLAIKLKNNDTYGISNSLNNLGLIYQEQGDIKKALNLHFQVLKIKNELNDLSGVGTALNNIGLDYFRLNVKDSALYYYEKSLETHIKANYNIGISLAYFNIASFYLDKKQYDKALENYIKCLEIRKKTKEMYRISLTYSKIANVYFYLNELQKAEKYAKKGLNIADSLQYIIEQNSAYNILYKIYKEEGKFDLALEMHEKFVKTNDSLHNKNTQKAIIKSQFQYDYNLKKISLEKEQEKKDLLRASEKKQQNTIIYFTIGILFILVLFLIVVYNRFQLSRKQNKIIEDKNNILNQTNKELENQKGLIEVQKKKIELTHTEVTDSIQYAERIQKALLSGDKSWENIGSEYFIFFKPRDVVSGDFYWAYSNNNVKVWVVADCTGHGVPGAFMSMLGIGFLNEIITEGNEFIPGIILDKLKIKIIKALDSQNSDSTQYDGMDISVCTLYSETNKLLLSGANNPLWIVRNGELIEFKADKMPIGNFPISKNFVTHEFKCEKNDLIYSFSDGFVDQFGGLNDKKFGTKQFKNLFLSNSQLPLVQQYQIIDDTFSKWTNNLQINQTDDICIVGIKI